jgi:diguanylate cyclase (GGDEF)-like protein
MYHILIIDDSSFILTVVEKALLRELPDIIVTKAHSYAQAVEKLAENTFHVAIVDVSLPDAPDGKAIDLVLEQSIPAIVLSSNMDDVIREEVLQKEIVEYIAKSDPNNISYAAFVVKRILNNYKTTVLVVDDFRSSRSFITRQLQKMHLNVLEASDPLEAIEILNNHPKTISMVLTDYEMPQMNGLEFTFYLRQHYRKDDLCIIAISALSDLNLCARFLKYGANDFLYKPFTTEELTVRVNSSLELIELMHEKKELAHRDFLSGLYNRRYFMEHGHLLTKTAHRNQRSLAVAMIDIDHFKVINDTYGHDIGDLVIHGTGVLLHTLLRESDLLARYGGEEFCLLMEDTTLEHIEKVTEKIRNTVQAHRMQIPDAILAFTVSIGVFYSASTTLETMMKRADENLYHAKQTGRNRVIITTHEAGKN